MRPIENQTCIWRVNYAAVGAELYITFFMYKYELSTTIPNNLYLKSAWGHMTLFFIYIFFIFRPVIHSGKE